MDVHVPLVVPAGLHDSVCQRTAAVPSFQPVACLWTTSLPWLVTGQSTGYDGILIVL